MQTLTFLCVCAATGTELPPVASFREERALTVLQCKFRALCRVRAMYDTDIVVICPLVPGKGFEYLSGENGVRIVPETLKEYQATLFGTFGTMQVRAISIGVGEDWSAVDAAVRELGDRLRAIWIIAHGFIGGTLAYMDYTGQIHGTTPEALVGTLLRISAHRGRSGAFRRAPASELAHVANAPGHVFKEAIPVIFGNCHGHVSAARANAVDQTEINFALRNRAYTFFSVASDASPKPRFNPAARHPNGKLSECADIDTRRVAEAVSGIRGRTPLSRALASMTKVTR